jgi:hypothetical protein
MHVIDEGGPHTDLETHDHDSTDIDNISTLNRIHTKKLAAPYEKYAQTQSKSIDAPTTEVHTTPSKARKSKKTI